MPSALLCLFLSSTLLCPFVVLSAQPLQCPPPYLVLCHPLYAAIFPAVPIALRLLNLCPQLCIATLPLLYIHLDFYLPFGPPCTQLCPYSVLILTPDLFLASVYGALPSNISLLCHLRPILLSSLFRYPPRPALSSALACPCGPFAMSFLPSDLPYLMPYLCLACRHVLISVLPFAQPSANPSTMY